MNSYAAFTIAKEVLRDTTRWLSSVTSTIELSTVFICGGVFVVSALVVYMISVFGIRERTYEEAMEEQRRRNQQASQNSKTDKSKKDKKILKFKKWGKKSKEKTDEEKKEEGEAKISDEEPKSEVDCSAQAGDSKGSNLRKRGKQKKSSSQDKEDSMPAMSSSEETDEPLSVACPSEVPPPAVEENAPKTTLSKNIRRKESESASSTDQLLDDVKDVKVEVKEVAKPAKKSPVGKLKKSDSDQDFGAEFYEWNTRILNVIRSILTKSTELPEEEIQSILNSLSAKQKGIALSLRQKNNEKKKSEIASLKKTIQERDESLKAEQRGSQSASERVNSLVLELDEQRSRWGTTEKSLREALHQEQQEIKALHGMMARKREQYGAEMSGLQSKMQQMKNKLKEDHAQIIQRLQEENSQLQSLSRIEAEKHQRSSLEISRLQHELEQQRSSREKIEAHQVQAQDELRRQAQQMEQLLSSNEEEKYGWQQRMTEMSAKMQQAENSRATLLQELQNAQKVCGGLESDGSALRQRLDEANRQLDGSGQDVLAMQGRLEESSRQQRELANCLEKMRKEVLDLSAFKRDQLQLIQSLQQENEMLASEVHSQRMAESQESQKQANGGSESPEKSMMMEIKEHEAMLEEKESLLQHVVQELEQYKSEIVSVTSELEALKKKNVELGESNRQLCESAIVSERRLQEAASSADARIRAAHDSSSKEMQDMLNEQIKEVEAALRKTFTQELELAQQDAETVRKDADVKLEKCERDANVRLEEFQESLYGRLRTLENEADTRVEEAFAQKEKLKLQFDDFENHLQTFLKNVFPHLHAPDSLDNKQQWNELEMGILNHLKELSTNSSESKDLENLKRKLETTSEEKTNFESQVAIYENVLAETESILKTLQNNIENEELQWKKELQSKEDTIKEILTENTELKSQMHNLGTNMGQLKDLKDALFEIEELRQRLKQEESEKKILMQKVGLLPDSATNEGSLSSLDSNLSQMAESNFLPSKSDKKKKARKKAAAKKAAA